jgi:hypothetical protein
VDLGLGGRSARTRREGEDEDAEARERPIAAMAPVTANGARIRLSSRVTRPG